MTFKDLNITEPILKAIEEKGYANPTPIQVKAIPAALTGKDILGCAQTGTGKTAAFAIPIIQHLQALKNRDKSIKTLILTPTRELALQISECIDDYAKYTQVRHGVIFGGVNQRAQVNMLHKGVDILVATPGRLLDLMNQGYIHLDNVRHFVLDEAAERRNIYVSDRRWKNIVRLLRTSAFMQDREEVDICDLLPIYHCLWQEPEERDAIRSIVIRALFSPFAEKLVEMKNALAEDIKYHRVRRNPDDGRDYEGEIETLSDGLTSLERQLGENLFVSSDDKAEISAYLRDFYKELAFTRQDTMKLYEA